MDTIMTVWTCTHCDHAVSLRTDAIFFSVPLDPAFGVWGDPSESDRPDPPEQDLYLVLRCSPCRELVSVPVVRACGPRPASDPYEQEPPPEPLERSRYPKRRRQEYPTLACPICHGHRLSVLETCLCPKCGAHMTSPDDPTSNSSSPMTPET